MLKKDSKRKNKLYVVQIFLSIITLSFSETTKTITDAQIQGRFNIINGSSAECVMHKFYTNSGWTQIEGESGKKKLINQMSQEWVLRTLDRLQTHKPLPEYNTTKEW